MGFRTHLFAWVFAAAHMVAPPVYSQAISITPVSDSAIPETFGNGANIALNALGGKLMASITQGEGYEANDLIDGLLADTSGSLNTSFGWSAVANSEPIDLVFAFHNDAVAQIAGLAFTPWRFENGVPIDMEIFASETGLEGSWVRVGENIGLNRSLVRQGFVFSEPIKAKVLWLRLLKNGGASTYHLGEVEVFETPDTTILSDKDIDLARPALGGSLVRPPRGDTLADGAIDGDPLTGYSTTFPAEFVTFTHAFRDGATALIKSVRISELPGASIPRPKSITIEYSNSVNPTDNFEMIGSIDIPWKDGRADIPITPNFKARFLRLKYFAAEGGQGLALGASVVLEGSGSGYVSVAAARRAKDNLNIDIAARPAQTPETQPDNTPALAQSLIPGNPVQQEIWPLADIDHLAVGAPPKDSRQSLVVQRTSGSQPDIALIRKTGETETVALGENTSVRQGDVLRVSRPTKASSVLLIDDSGSMQGTRGAVIEAVRGFFDSRLPHEETAIIRFSSGVTTLSDFSSDSNQLLAAVEGQLDQTGSTALYDGLIAALDKLEGKRGDRVIVLLSDGANSAGNADLQTVWDRVVTSGVRVYAIGLGSGLDYHGSVIGLAATPWRALQFFAGATSGQAMRAPTADALNRIYEQISADLRAPSVYTVALTTEVIERGELQVEYANGILTDVDAPVVEIIFDASGSMRDRKRKIDGRLKIDVAKEVTQALIDSLPDGTQVGLRVFGHRVREGDEFDCSDIELIVPHGPLDRQGFANAVANIRPLGTTPIYSALLISLGDLRDLGPGPKKVVLITDGKEECRDPTEVIGLAQAFEAFGVDLQLDVVGFALADDATKSVMTQAAEVTGGIFTDAQDAAALADGLRRAFKSARLVAFNAAGQEFVGEVGGPPLALEAGAYEINVMVPNGPLKINNVDVLEGERLSIMLSRDNSGRFGLTSARAALPAP